MQKKLMLLGGSAQQVVAIETAKRLGYITVLCDYLHDNPGQYHADKFYQVSTTDKEAVFAVALREKIDGIVALIMAFNQAIQLNVEQEYTRKESAAPDWSSFKLF